MSESNSVFPNASATKLAELARSHDREICQSVARHPNTSPKTLKQLFQRFPKAVLENPIIDLLVLENPNFFSELFNSNPDCFNCDRLPLFYLEWALNSSDLYILDRIAASDFTPEEILFKLALNEDPSIRYAVANNLPVSDKVANILVKDTDRAVLSLLAKNPKISSEILDKLSHHQYEIVRINVAANQNIANKTALKLLKDENLDVIKNLAQNPHVSEEILNKLAEHESEVIRVAVASNSNISEKIAIALSKDNSRIVVLSLAKNQNLPANILDELSNRESIFMTIAVAENNNTSLATLTRLIQYPNPQIRSAIASNQNISLEIIEQLLLDRKNDILCNLSNNPKTPTTILERLFYIATGKYFTWEILNKIVVNPNTSTELQEKIYLAYRDNIDRLSDRDLLILDNLGFKFIMSATNIEIKRTGWTTDMGKRYRYLNKNHAQIKPKLAL